MQQESKKKRQQEQADKEQMDQLKSENELAKVYNDSETIELRLEQMSATNRSGIQDSEPQMLTPT